MVDAVTALKVLAGIQTDRSVIREIGRELARGMADGGNVSGYSSATPSGGAAQRGVAGGRGGGLASEEVKQIKASQLQAKIQNDVIQSYKTLNKQLSLTEKSFDQAQDNIEIFARVFNRRWDDVIERVSGSVNAQDRLIRNLNAAGFDQVKTLQDVLDLREEQLKLEEQLLNAKGSERAQLENQLKQYKKMSKAMGEATEHLDNFGDRFEDYMSSLKRTFFTTEAAMGFFTRALLQSANDLKAQMRFGGTGLTFSEMFQNQYRALVKGLDPAVYTEVAATARQAALQFEDMGTFSARLGERQREYFGYIGDTAEATRFAGQTMMLLGRAGIEPTSDAFNSLGESFKFLNFATGMTSDQFTGMMDQLILDEDMQVKLRAAREDERAAIIAGLGERLKNNVAMGMSTEKMLEAARAMGRIAGGTAKDRIRQAAMARTTFAAMGVQGGDRAAELIMRGQRMNADERQELQTLMGRVSQQVAETKLGPLAGELFADTLIGKSGLEPFLGASSPFNTTLEKQFDLDKEQRNKILQAIQEGPGILADLVFGKEVIQTAITDNPIVAGALGILSTLGIMKAGGALKGLLTGGGKVGIFSRIAGMFGGGGAAAAGGGAAAAGGMGILGSTAAVGGAGALGYGIGTLINNIGTFFGGRQLSTVLLDAFTDFNDYDPNADYQHLMSDSNEKAAAASEAIIEPTNMVAENTKRTMSATEEMVELLRVQTEVTVGALSENRARDRLAAMNMNSQPVMLASG